jgi:hypothetical protein
VRARLFTAEVVDGRLDCPQKLPDGEWEAKPVKVELT